MCRCRRKRRLGKHAALPLHGFCAEKALCVIEDEQTPVRQMLAQKLRAAAEKSEWWAAVVRADLSMYRGPKLDEVLKGVLGGGCRSVREEGPWLGPARSDDVC